MKLYTNTFSPNCRKVYAVLEHTGLKAEHEVVDLRAGAQYQPEFVAINPNSKVPALQTDEGVLWESNAIMAFVAAKADSELWPKSQERYEILRWMFWESNHLSQTVGKLIGQFIFNADNIDAAIVDSGMKDFRKYTSVLNGQLEGKQFILGDRMTLADYAGAVWFGYEQPCQLPVSEFPHVQAWLKRVEGQKGGALLAPPRR